MHARICAGESLRPSINPSVDPSVTLENHGISYLNPNVEIKALARTLQLQPCHHLEDASLALKDAMRWNRRYGEESWVGVVSSHGSGLDDLY